MLKPGMKIAIEVSVLRLSEEEHTKYKMTIDFEQQDRDKKAACREIKMPNPLGDIWEGFSVEAREICENSDLMKSKKDS